MRKSEKFDCFQIDAAKRYTASLVMTGPNTCCGYQGTSSKTVPTKKGDVVFNFVQSDLSTGYTTVAYGQVPQILFRV